MDSNAKSQSANIQNFYSLIEKNTLDFVGRSWLFSVIKKWANDSSSPRYLMITGKAGTGKSSIAARLWEISEGIIRNESLTKGFISALYVCSSKDSQSKNPVRFSKSLSQQLIEKDSDFAEALIENLKGEEKNITMISNISDSIANEINGIIVSIDRLNSNIANPEILFSNIFREPIEQVLRKEPNKKYFILIDGLDELNIYESSDSILNLISNLETLSPNVKFILTLRDNDRIMKNFNNSKIVSLSDSYLDNSTYDILDFVNFKVNHEQKLKAIKNEYQQFPEDLAKGSNGNFLHVKFLLDAILEGKYSPTPQNITNLPPLLDDIYREQFASMEEKYPREFEKMLKVLHILSVSFEALTESDLGFLLNMGSPELRSILRELKPFMQIKDKINNNLKRPSYALHHQSLIDFFREENYFNKEQAKKVDNYYYLSESENHLMIVEKYYDKSKGIFKVDGMNKYGLKYLADHLFALINTDNENSSEWFANLILLAEDDSFEQKQNAGFPFEYAVTLNTVRRALEVSLEKGSPFIIAKMMLLYVKRSINIANVSPLSIIFNNLQIERSRISITNLNALSSYLVNQDGNSETSDLFVNEEVMERAWQLVDLRKENILTWYLIMSFALHVYNNSIYAEKTLERLISKYLESLYDNELHINIHLVFLLFEAYPNKLKVLLEKINDDFSLFEICKFFINQENRSCLNIFSCVKNKSFYIIDFISILHEKKILKHYSKQLINMIGNYRKETHDNDSRAISDISRGLILIMTKNSGDFSNIIKLANTISANYDKSRCLSSISVFMAKLGYISEAIDLSDGIEPIQRSVSLASIAKKIISNRSKEEALNFLYSLHPYYRSRPTAEIAYELVASGSIADVFDIIGTLESPYGAMDIIAAISYALIQQKKYHEISNIIRLISYDAYSKATLMASIAISFLEKEKVKEARALLMQSIDLVKGLANSNDKSETLILIVRKMIQSGIEKNIPEILSDLLKKVDEYNIPVDKSRIMMEIAKMFLKKEPLKSLNLMDNAMFLASDVNHNDSKSSSLSIIARELKIAGHEKESNDLFDRAISIANEVKDDFKQSKSLQTITDNLISVELLDKALISANSINISYQHETFVNLAKAMIKKKRIEEAIGLVNKIYYLNLRSQSVSDIAKELSIHKYSKKAEECYSNAAKIARNLDSFHKDYTLLYIITNLAQSGSIDNALVLVKEITEEYYQMEALTEIATSMIKKKRIEEAINQIYYIFFNINRSDKSKSLSIVARELKIAGHEKESNDLFEHAKNVAEIEENLFLKIKCVSSIARELKIAGHEKESNDLFDRAISIADGLDKHDSSRSESLSEVVQDSVACNFYDKAISIANSIKDFHQSQSLFEIVFGRIEQGIFLPSLVEGIHFMRGHFLEKIARASINSPTPFWNYILKQCIDSPELAYYLCSLIAMRYPQEAKEIADLMLKHSF